MADIELVIKIPEDTYQYVMNTGTYGHYRFNSARAIRNSTPLPKGHGRLIDASEVVKAYAFEKKTNALSGDDDAFIEAIKRVSTIIEVDKE